MSTPTLGAANSGPRMSPVVIQEIMYHPPNNDRYLEYITIYNNGNSRVVLDNWTLSEGVAFAFPAGMTFEAGAKTPHRTVRPSY